jgi:DMSO/TMAO reductase YedYZ molybdopterin-dependent catalytic subunit
VGLLAVALTLFLRQALRGPPTVNIGGAVAAPYDYPLEHDDIAEIGAEGTLQEVTAQYTGIPVRELIARAQPGDDASLLLVRATDGYAFFVSMDEVAENEGLLLAAQGEGEETSYNIVGAQNSKAWVRGVEELVLVGSATLEVAGALDNPTPYDPDDWQYNMDSTRLDVGEGPQKYQGAPLGQVLEAMGLQPGASTVVINRAGDPISIPLEVVLDDDGVRVFAIIGEEKVSFAVARMDGEVLAADTTGIEVR